MKALCIRLFDTDGTRLASLEQQLRTQLRQHQVTADVEPVACHLEIGRQGLSGKEPAIQANGYIVTAGQTVSEDMLDDMCRRLAIWQQGSDNEA